MPDVQDTLNERGARYGDFTHHAGASDAILSACEAQPNWPKLDAVKRQAIRVICDKLGRILSGDPEYRDSWRDIQGYAKLAEDRCLDPDADKQGVLDLSGCPVMPELRHNYTCEHGVNRVNTFCAACADFTRGISVPAELDASDGA